MIDYVTYGGLPLTVTMKTEEQELNDLINILASGIGALSNPFQIEAMFKCVI